MSRNQSKFIPKNHRPNPSPDSERVLLSEAGEWVGASTDGRFINYLPQDEAVAAGLGAEDGGLDVIESQRVVDVLNRELSRLLRLNPREFWKEVVSDTSLHEFLDSFLKFRSRWYDLPYRGAKGVVAGVIVGECELCRRVFMVLLRLSSNRDPGARAANALSAKDHEVLLQEKKLLDLPKLLDICAVYGHENADLSRTLVSNAFKAQPWMYESLTNLISHFLNIIQTMQQRCHSSIEFLFSSGSGEEAEFSRLCSDFLEVMDFINDAISSMDALVTAYRPSALVFSCPVETSYGNGELLGNLVQLHDSLLPLLRKAFNVILQSAEDGHIFKVSVSLKLLSARLVSFGFKLVDACYLSEDLFENDLYRPAATKMFPAKVEDPVIRADIVIQTLKEMNSLSYPAEENRNPGTYLQIMQKNFNLMDRLRELRLNGWMCMDDEQFHYLSGITMSNVLESTGAQSDAPIVTNKSMQMDEDSAILESKISQIRDLFPDYGKGFLVSCLEVYDENPEEVIQRILEGNLHPDLQSLDPSMETMPKIASVPVKNDKGKGRVLESVSALNISTSTDKGKGKMSESSSMRPAHVADDVESHRREGLTLSSSSSTGRFIRKSKSDVPDTDILDSRHAKDSARVSALVSQYEYEDEYDDSFDELGLGGVESGFEESEEMGDRVNLTMGKSRDAETEVSSSLADTGSAKWGSRKKPQYYVKDGKNYSYKVEGSTAVANINEAKLMNQVQSELIHGLGRGGNIPLGAVRKLAESQEQEKQPVDFEIEGRGRGWDGGRGRGRRGRGGRHGDSHGDQGNNDKASEEEGRGIIAGDQRGRGRGRGGRSNHYRKDRAMNKHFSGVSGF